MEGIAHANREKRERAGENLLIETRGGPMSQAIVTVVTGSPELDVAGLIISAAHVAAMFRVGECHGRDHTFVGFRPWPGSENQSR